MKYRRRIICGLIGTCAVLVVLLPASGTETARLRPSPDALPAIQAPAVVSDTASCASACQVKHDQCRVSTKGGPDCDAQRQRCLQDCLTKKPK